MFFKKNYHEIRWDERPKQTPTAKLTMTIESIKPFKWSFFGTRNSDAALDFVHNAMEVRGKVIGTEAITRDIQNVLFLVPEEEVSALRQGDSIIMSLSNICYCVKFEKMAAKGT